MAVILENVYYKYDVDDNTSEEYGIFDISLKVEQGKTVGIIGKTGSGKSTLMQHLNALYLPQQGRVIVGDFIVDRKSKDLKNLRKKVGMVFQYPEDQLFEETIYNDLAFGPKNLGLTNDQIEKAIKGAMEDLELDFESMRDRSPYELSGGQKRKVAIASVLAMNPEILVLDEPTAGLDPKSKNDLLDLLISIKKKRNLTLFFVSHNMDDVFLLTEYVYVMCDGRIVFEGLVDEVFQENKKLRDLNLGVPFSVEVLELLAKRGMYKGVLKPMELDELADLIKNILRGSND
ncbi:MAG: energy-coupling factor transporter ATPase [Firmicutes bacterium]|nr:energy-coupling factor transporter ATPase [Bacillota bacterium]